MLGRRRGRPAPRGEQLPKRLPASSFSRCTRPVTNPVVDGADGTFKLQLRLPKPPPDKSYSHPMKSTLLPALLTLGILTAGCQSTPDTSSAPTIRSSTPAAATIDTTALQHAFRNADLPTVQTVNAIASAVAGRNYSGALADLQRISRIPGLTHEQDTAVRQLVGQLQGRAGS